MGALKVLVVAKFLGPGGVGDFVYMTIKKSTVKTNFIPFGIGHKAFNKNKMLKAICSIVDCIRIIVKIRNFDFDAVQLNPSLRGRAILRDGLFIIMISLFRLDKIIVFFHGWDTQMAETINDNRLYSLFFKWAFSRASTIIVLANQFKTTLKEMGFDTSKIKVLTMMYDEDIFLGLNRSTNLSGKRILFLSRLIKEKGVYELLKAFEIISKKYGDVQLVIAGSGPEYNKMFNWVSKRRLTKRISFPGYLRGKDKAQTMLDSDCFVLPSYSEGSPVSLIEAMAAGLPVITTETGGIPDIVTNGVNGTLLDNLSPKTIAGSIQNYIEGTKDFIDAIRWNTRRTVDRYEAKAVTAKLEAIIHDAVMK